MAHQPISLCVIKQAPCNDITIRQFGLFLIESIKQPLQILLGILLAIGSELGVVFGDEEFEVVGADGGLVLLDYLLGVYYACAGVLLGVLAAVEADVDLGDLAIEALRGDCFALLGVL